MAQVEAYQKRLVAIFEKEYSHLWERKELYTSTQAVARFGIAREFEEEKVVEMWRSWIKWYEEYRPDLISEDEEIIAKIHTSGKYRFCGVDKAGCPVLVIRMRYHIVGLATAEQNLRYLLYMIEKGVRLAAQASTPPPTQTPTSSASSTTAARWPRATMSPRTA